MSNITIRNKIVSGPEEELIPAHLSYGQFLFDQMKKGGNEVAQICAETGRTSTYNEILQNSVNFAVSLQKLGLKKGDVVTLSSENRFEFTVTALAVMYNGAILSTLNVLYAPGEITHMLDITKPKLVICSPFTSSIMHDCIKDMRQVEHLIQFGNEALVPGLLYEDLVKVHFDVRDFVLADVNGMSDTLAVMCSSGTTGLPKGVELTHVNFLTLAQHMKYYLHTSIKQKNHNVKVMTSMIPWFHAYGFITHFAVLALRVQTVFMVRFQEELFLNTIQKYKVNMLLLVPPLAVFLAKHPMVLKYDLSSVNEIWCGAAPLSRDIQEAACGRMPSLDFIRQGYGLTEVTMACCVDLSRGDKLGSCGCPAPGMKIKVLDIESKKLLGAHEKGELWIKSPLRMKGYMNNREASDQLIDKEGYVQTGDIGYYDEDGFFYIVDRLKELIKYKGFQVAPAELEALLLQHGGVRECGVIGKQDIAAGELPTAFVVKQPGANVTEKELIDYVASKVSSAKHLRGGVIFIDELPKNPTGKILRKDLRQMLETKSKL